MLVVLYPVLVTFLMTFTSAEVEVEVEDEIPDTAMAVRQPQLDGKVSNDHLLFQMRISFELDCASACMKHGCCVAFSTSPKDPPSKTMTCRGHDSRSVSQSSTVKAPGSRTYFMEDGPSGSNRLERPCKTDSDCPASMTCFAPTGQCLCQPEYDALYSPVNRAAGTLVAAVDRRIHSASMEHLRPPQNTA